MLSFATQRCIPVHALIKFTAKRRNAVCIKATADIFPRLPPKEHRADGALYTVHVQSVHHTARLGLVKLNTCSLYGGKLRDLWNNPLKMMDNVIDNIYTSIYDKYLQVNAGGYPKRKKIIKTEFVTSRIFVLFVINILSPLLWDK